MGATQNSLKQTPRFSNKSKFFKPLVAGSLAVVLGASVASADCTSSPFQTCFVASNGAARPDNFAAIKNNLSFALADKYYHPQWKGTLLEEIHFIHDGISGGPTRISADIDAKKLTITGYTQMAKPSFSIASQDNPMQIGATGSGKLIVDFSPSTIGRTFFLQTGTKNTGAENAFHGNIDVIAGETIPNRVSGFKGEFFGSVKGDITIKNSEAGSEKFFTQWYFSKLEGTFESLAATNYIYFNTRSKHESNAIFMARGSDAHNIIET